MFWRKKQPKPTWRIVKDAHFDVWYVEQWRNDGYGLGPKAWHYVWREMSLDKAEAWLSRELGGPVVCGLFDAGGRAFQQ